MQARGDMTPIAVRTFWIIGTSVSIEDGGYVTLLAERARAIGMQIRNLSVGDQTSVIGYMRLLAHRVDIQAADVVVWEYSLLDKLLTEPEDNIFHPDDVHAARRLAWQCIFKIGAALIVVLIPPKKYLSQRNDCEVAIAEDARLLDVPCLDARELFTQLDIENAELHYRDDRHPRHESPVIAALVDALISCAAKRSRIPTKKMLSVWNNIHPAPNWRWQDAATLLKNNDATLQQFRNSLVTVDAVQLVPGAATNVPAATRVVATGIVSMHNSGGLWCGHLECTPVSARLPSDLPYSFLLRITRLPCKRNQVSKIASAEDSAYDVGVWNDYGQAASRQPGPVAIFGILYEPLNTRKRWLSSARDWISRWM